MSWNFQAAKTLIAIAVIERRSSSPVVPSGTEMSSYLALTSMPTDTSRTAQANTTSADHTLLNMNTKKMKRNKGKHKPMNRTSSLRGESIAMPSGIATKSNSLHQFWEKLFQ